MLRSLRRGKPGDEKAFKAAARPVVREEQVKQGTGNREQGTERTCLVCYSDPVPNPFFLSFLII